MKKSIASRRSFLCLVVAIIFMAGAILGNFTLLGKEWASAEAGENSVDLQSPDNPYKTKYKSKEEAVKAAYDLSVEIASEGIVVLKNEGNAVLPISKTDKISILGKSSVNPIVGGAGSGFVNPRGDGTVTIYSSLRDEGFDLNPEAEKFYMSQTRSGVGRAAGGADPGVNSAIPTAGYMTGETRFYKTEDATTAAGFYPSQTFTQTRVGGTGNRNGTASATVDFVSSYTGGVTQVYGDLIHTSVSAANGNTYDTNGTFMGDAALHTSFETYNDVALVVFSRIAGEGFDLPRVSRTRLENSYPVAGRSDSEEHYLRVDDNEAALLQFAGENFDKVVVIINAAGFGFEMDFLDNPNAKGYHPNLGAAIMAGSPGRKGYTSFARILSGEVNPSGKLTTQQARDFMQDPAIQNFGNNNIGTGTTGNGHQYLDASGSAQSHYMVNYDEGIYLGYRYWETRGYTESLKPAGTIPNPNPNWMADGESEFISDPNHDPLKWYKDHVVYTFGHGLSYTNFEWEIVSASPAANAALTKGGKIEIDVKVTNKGARPGKDVVQLYYTAPYYTGGIAKSHVVLGNFEKTKELQPNESEVLTLEMYVQDMASYDFKDVNANGHKGYELEAGEYTIWLAKDAHGWAEGALNVKYNVAKDADEALINPATTTGFKYAQDRTTNAPVGNLFDDVSTGMYGASWVKDYTGREWTMSRDDFAGTFPQMSVNTALIDSGLGGANEAGSTLARSRRVQQTTGFLFSGGNLPDSNSGSNTNTIAYDAGQPWEVTDPDYFVNNPVRTTAMTVADNPMLLKELIGVSYDDAKWAAFINQLTPAQMVEMSRIGAFEICGVSVLGIPRAVQPDGPMGFCNNGTGGSGATPINMTNCAYPSTAIQASTWNKELMYRAGLAYGEEGLWGTGARVYSGLYGTATNTFRTPFSGRNFEYYSEDGILAGMILGNLVKGMQEKGVAAYLKHFFMNDQETNRNDLYTWATEQTMREIYAKPFELAVKIGGATGVMTGFNRLGNVINTHSWPALNGLLRNEWRFRGAVITDWGGSSWGEFMIRAGTDFYLGGGGDKGASQYTVTGAMLTNATQISALRTAAKNLCYQVVNSTAMNFNRAEDMYEGGTRLLNAAVRGLPYRKYDSSNATNWETQTGTSGSSTILASLGNSIQPVIPATGYTTFTLASGALPNGMSQTQSNGTRIGQNGVLCGAPSATNSAAAPGVYNFRGRMTAQDISVSAPNSSSGLAAANLTAEQDFQIRVLPRNSVAFTNTSPVPSGIPDFASPRTVGSGLKFIDNGSGAKMFMESVFQFGESADQIVEYRLRSGDVLPAGYTLSADGVITGPGASLKSAFATASFAVEAWSQYGLVDMILFDGADGVNTEGTILDLQAQIDELKLQIAKLEAAIEALGDLDSGIIKTLLDTINSLTDRIAALEATGPGADGATWYSGAGAPTTQGKEGDFYLDTTTWDVYNKGASGWGTAIGNIKGATGGTGADGATWYSGAGAPTTQGKEGDFYLDTTTWDVYKKGASGWETAIGNIKGATGSTGLTGPSGANGKSAFDLWKEIEGNGSKTEAEFFASLVGATGGTGTPGADGATWYSGTSAPTTQGKEGDFYLNTATWDVYKKGASGWGTAIGNIKGETGPKGGGCSSSSASIVALFSLLVCTFVVIIKKQF